jgi:predicted ArsR family transcriptional regulator
MKEGGDLPREVVQAVDAYVDSLVGLEILLLLYREQGRTWTAEQAAGQLRIPVAGARRELERMADRNVVSNSGGGEAGFRFQPADDERALAVQLIADAYGSRRIALINHVATQALQRIRSIAEAFRLKKEGGNE